jgi:membrane protease YdiL (CAAX protease family)
VTWSTLSSALILALCVLAFCVAMGLREQVNIWLGTGAAALTALVLLRSSFKRDGDGMWQVTNRNVLVGVVTGLVMSLATWALYPLSGELVPQIHTEVPKLYALLRQTPGPVAAFPVLVVVVLAEECVWRGLAIDLFARGRPGASTVFLSAVVYTFPQIAFRSPLLVVVAMACGLVWGGLRIQTRGLVAPLIAHLTWDLLVFVLYPVA